jgi:hypothetical protein
LAVERPIPGFGPDNIAPVVNLAYEELHSIVADMGLDEDRVYLSCYDVSSPGEITMFLGTPVPDEVTEARASAGLVLLPGTEVAPCVRQGTTRGDSPAPARGPRGIAV